MSILITGGCGYIGSTIAYELSVSGQDVIVIDDLSTGFKQLLRHDEVLYEGDFADFQCLDKIFDAHKIEGVIHCAASIKVDESVSKPEKYYRNNCSKTLDFVGYCGKKNVKAFVFTSTAAVYGDTQNKAATEDFPILPESPYGYSKAFPEQMIRDVAPLSKMGYGILRCFNVAGAHPSLEIGQMSPYAEHLITICSRRALSDQPAITIYGDDYDTSDGSCVRDYIHVADLAAVHIAALKHLLAGGNDFTLNCGYGKGYSVKEIISAFEKANGVSFQKTIGPRRQGDPASIVAAANRVKELLKVEYKYEDLTAILKTAYQWEKKLSKS